MLLYVEPSGLRGWGPHTAVSKSERVSCHTKIAYSLNEKKSSQYVSGTFSWETSWIVCRTLGYSTFSTWYVTAAVHG